MSDLILTVGHSNRPYLEFLKKLQEHNIDVLVDIRTFPRSRFCPWFNQKSLSEELGKANITYLFKGNNLGGKGENIAYDEAINELVEMTREGKRVCVCCSEGDFKQCHRHTMLEPSFMEKGLAVEHIKYK